MKRQIRDLLRYFLQLKFRIPPFVRSSFIREPAHLSLLRKDGILLINPSNFDFSWMHRLLEACSKISIPENKNSTNRKDYRLYLTNQFESVLLSEICNEAIFLDIAYQYFRRKPQLNYCSVWLDFPTGDAEKETQLWHRDPDDPFLLKIFIYLNDVNMNNGPFTFAPGSHTMPFGKWERQVNLSNRYIEFNAVGEKGTIIIADTNGLHKGLLPEQGHRILLTINYTSLNPRFGVNKNIFQ